MAARTRVAAFGAYNGRRYGSMARGYGTLLIPDFANWAGTAQASFNVPSVVVVQLSNRVQVLALTDYPVDSGADMTITSAEISAGTSYMVVGWDSDGTNSFRRAVTAT